MPDSSRQLEDALVELAWSQWTALGVSGWRLASRGADTADVAVDPEALILLTASLAHADPRLRDEATDWCVTFGRYVSKVRLKNLLRLDVADARAFHSFAATVNGHARLGWPENGEQARPFKPTHRSKLAVRGEPAAIRVRARLIFGVSARAEILVLLASEQHSSSSASEIAERVSYGRRNVVEALDALLAVGLVRQVDAPGARRYGLADPTALHAILGGVPEHFIDWGRSFKACWIALRTLRSFEGSSPTVRAVEAAKAADMIESELMRFWSSPPRRAPAGTNAWERFGPWALDLVEILQDPSRAEFAPGRRRRASRSRAKVLEVGRRVITADRRALDRLARDKRR